MGSETEEQPVPSWEEVARTHGRFLYTVAYRLTGNPADAEDLVQEVLLRVRRGLATYRPGSMEGWLSRITTNVFLDDVRRQRRRPAVVMADPPDALLPAAPSADEALASTTLPDRVQAALARLPEDFRAAVVLCDVVGESYEQIAESLGIPIGTVRSRIHRARALLRDALSKDDGDGADGA
ncbi:MAG: sigma-70 family RNA polymerase sigma factor [Actinobacteria bacterium]|nr:sigma-70 family RNA polymerase sigma factor [Actinomycetota bacterium]